MRNRELIPCEPLRPYVRLLWLLELDDPAAFGSPERVESGPGIRARLTLEIKDRYRFMELYEIAWPGKELELYFTNQWTRTPVLDTWH